MLQKKGEILNIQAAERVSSAWLTTECWKDDLTLAVVRMAIKGDSVTKENLITDHIVDTNKKLAIALKALESVISYVHDNEPTMGQMAQIVENALKEIQQHDLPDFAIWKQDQI